MKIDQLVLHYASVEIVVAILALVVIALLPERRKKKRGPWDKA